MSHREGITMIRRHRRVAIYVRVSTDGQTCANQERELRAVAEAKDCEIVKVYQDHGISGAKGRDKRPSSTRYVATPSGGSSTW
jgi:DNA invertase Pin-like site-specific DNA recombinase